jgi:hypothetical protein
MFFFLFFLFHYHFCKDFRRNVHLEIQVRKFEEQKNKENQGRIFFNQGHLGKGEGRGRIPCPLRRPLGQPLEIAVIG